MRKAILTLTLNLPSDPNSVSVARALTATLLERYTVAREDVQAASLIVSELATNVVRHAYRDPGGRYRLQLSYFGEYLLITVTDRGKGFDPKAIPPPSAGQQQRLGLSLIEEVADWVEFKQLEKRGTWARARVRLRYPASPAGQEYTKDGTQRGR
ncbi:MAG: ATP-binding protein [Armatimonadetes bacterium]|nr:ATP-binding protein [Armatimonadota bacterium]